MNPLKRFETRTEEQKNAQRIDRGRDRLMKKLRRQEKRGKISNATLAYQSALSADAGSTLGKDGTDLKTKSASQELDRLKEQRAGERIVSNNINEGFLLAADTLMKAVPVAAPINMLYKGARAEMDAIQDGTQGDVPGGTMLKSIGRDALNFGIDEYGEDAFDFVKKKALGSRASKEASRLARAQDALTDAKDNQTMNLVDGGDGLDAQKRIDSMESLVERRTERNDIAQENLESGSLPFIGDINPFKAVGVASDKINSLIDMSKNMRTSIDFAKNKLGLEESDKKVVEPQGMEYSIFDPNEYN